MLKGKQAEHKKNCLLTPLESGNTKHQEGEKDELNHCDLVVPSDGFVYTPISLFIYTNLAC